MPLTADQIKAQILFMTNAERETLLKDLYGNPDDLGLEGKKVLALLKGLPVEREEAPELGSIPFQAATYIKDTAATLDLELYNRFAILKTGFPSLSDDFNNDLLTATFTNPLLANQPILVTEVAEEEMSPLFWYIQIDGTGKVIRGGRNFIKIFNDGIEIGVLEIIQNNT
jgi:hypothetical protein